MQTKVVEPTQESLPVEKLQTPSDQNVDAINTLESKNTNYLKKTVRGLGKATIVLSVAVILMSIVEVITVTCHPLPVYDESYYYYADTGCNTETSWGVGIWCSVVPFLAGVFGVIAGSKSSSQKKNGLLMGFSIVGAIISFVLIVLQTYLYESWMYMYADYNAFKYGLQIAIMSTTGINSILLITSSVYSCCLCIPCCGQSIKIVEHQIVCTYLPYDPNQQVANQPTPDSLKFAQETELSKDSKNFNFIQSIPPPQYNHVVSVSV